MILSYSMRLLCLFVAGLGLLQIGFEIVFWLCSPVILRVFGRLPVRHGERLLYAAQLFPFVLALAFTVFFAVPRYVSNETNFSPEAVGWGCVLLAGGLSIWWTAKLAGGIGMVARTAVFRKACGSDNATPRLADRTPVIMVAGASPRVALVGLLRPFIFISRSLIEDGGLGRPALEVVLDHERSHAVQGDNWKLLSLHCLPRLNLPLKSGRTWMQLWQNAAEWAADEDAVQGDSARALLLAETLVTLARSNSFSGPPIACTNFVCEQTDLALRVERLIDAKPRRRVPFDCRIGLILGCVALSGAVALANFSSMLSEIPERLLHLG